MYPVTLSHLLPEPLFRALIPLLGIVGILARLVGLKRMAAALWLAALTFLAAPLMYPLASQALTRVPWWVAAMVLVMGFLTLLRHITALFIGRDAAAQMVGSLAADLLKWLILGLGRLSGRLARRVGKLVSAYPPEVLVGAAIGSAVALGLLFGLARLAVR